MGYENKGIFFESTKHISNKYIVVFNKKENTVFGYYQKDLALDISPSLIGENVKIYSDFNDDWLFKIELSNKYYFPVFNSNLQFYYSDNLYQKFSLLENKEKTLPSDDMGALSDCVKFAIEESLKRFKIKIY